jgi:hypothetical protein
VSRLRDGGKKKVATRPEEKNQDDDIEAPTHTHTQKDDTEAAPVGIEVTMVLPNRRTSAPSGKRVMMDDDDDVQAGVKSQCRSFPATPHPSKKRRHHLEEQNTDESSTTPRTGSSAGTESTTTTDTKEIEPFIEVSNIIYVGPVSCLRLKHSMPRVCHVIVCNISPLRLSCIVIAVHVDQ